jgi:hypothetical protein
MYTFLQQRQDASNWRQSNSAVESCFKLSHARRLKLWNPSPEALELVTRILRGKEIVQH